MATSNRQQRDSRELTAEEFIALGRGDTHIYRKVFDAYVGLVHFVLGKFNLASEVREEIVQETFLKLFERAGDIAEAGKVKAWLVVTARNQAIDYLRRNKRVSLGATGDEVYQIDAAAGESIEESLQRELEVRAASDLVDEISGMPGGDTFRQFYREGLTARVIAERNGEAVSTVTTRLSRLRLKFKERLREKLDELHAVIPLHGDGGGR